MSKVLTMTGNTMAATVDFRTQRSARHRIWMKVNRCTFLSGTCRRYTRSG